MAVGKDGRMLGEDRGLVGFRRLGENTANVEGKIEERPNVGAFEGEEWLLGRMRDG
jgi:hypothetical protein